MKPGLCYKLPMLPDLKTLLVLNPHAGKGRGLKNFAAIRELLGGQIKSMDVQVSEYAGHAFQIVMLAKHWQGPAWTTLLISGTAAAASGTLTVTRTI